MASVPSLELPTRIGFAARGAMYMIIGYLALRFGRAEGGTGALARLAEGNGRLLLAVMTAGFLAYGLWRLAEALVDSEGHGADAKGWIVRAGGAASGLVHLGFAWLAAGLALGQAGSVSGGEAEQGAAAALALPGGTILLAATGAALIAAGLRQLALALRAGFLRHLDPRAAQRRWIKWLGRAGYAARGIVFLLAGWFFVRAGLSADASEAGGIEQALAALPHGMLDAVALGLGLFGLFSLVEARYRRINDPAVIARLARAARA